MANGKKRTSIIRIVIWMVIFFPVGIYFWHKRLTEDKTGTLQNSKYSAAIGWILFVFGIISGCFAVIAKITSHNNRKQDIIITGAIIAVFILSGFVTIKRSKKMKTLGERYLLYVNIVNEGETNISNIADRMSITEDEAIEDLENMVNGGFFKGAYVDIKYKKIICYYICDIVTDIIYN